jgi:hypothetical protein
MDFDNPDDPRWRARKAPPSWTKILVGSGNDTPILGLVVAFSICAFIWIRFNKFIKEDTARTTMLVAERARKIREAEDKLERTNIMMEEKAKRENAGLPVSVTQYKNSNNANMRDVKGAPKDVL